MGAAKAADGLLAADRGFAAASAQRGTDAAFPAMFADNAVMPVSGRFVEGRNHVLEALGAPPAAPGARVSWTPIRVGVSADGQQGFTFGYMTLASADGASTPFKYLAYWVKSGGAWRIVAYRRGRAPAAAPTIATMPASLPGHTVAPSADEARTAAFRTSLDSAERAFSRDAQTIGLGPAFQRYGRLDAVNMGGARRATFAVSPDSIAALVSTGESGGSSVSWGPDRVIVASSGDLGVTIGTIRVNAADASGQHQTFPFFTVWRRDSPSEPWRYIAE
ncbi:MAG: nuclear transport factor 2 family protein [Gemmatimonadota bacterium]